MILGQVRVPGEEDIADIQIRISPIWLNCSPCFPSRRCCKDRLLRIRGKEPDVDHRGIWQKSVTVE